jgi:hypothetical protein
LVESKETESSESENAKIAGENNVDCIFYVKDIFHHEYVPEKRIVKDKCYKELIKRLISRVHRIRSEFQESGSWYLLHDNAPAHFLALSPSFWRNYSHDLALADFFFIP